MKNCARALLFVVAISVSMVAASSLPIPNRGTQLFLLLEGPSGVYLVVAMDEPSRPVIETWNRYNPTYDFISAVATPTEKGCKLGRDLLDDVVHRDAAPAGDWHSSGARRQPAADSRRHLLPCTLGQHDACAPYTNLISSRHQTQPNLRPSHKSFVQGDLSNESARGRYHRVSIGDHMLASGIEDVKDSRPK